MLESDTLLDQLDSSQPGISRVISVSVAGKCVTSGLGRSSSVVRLRRQEPSGRNGAAERGFKVPDGHNPSSQCGAELLIHLSCWALRLAQRSRNTVLGGTTTLTVPVSSPGRDTGFQFARVIRRKSRGMEAKNHGKCGETGRMQLLQTCNCAPAQ